jgi:hypothetical protein
MERNRMPYDTRKPGNKSPKSQQQDQGALEWWAGCQSGWSRYAFRDFRIIRRDHCTPRNPSASAITTTPTGNPATL